MKALLNQRSTNFRETAAGHIVRISTEFFDLGLVTDAVSGPEVEPKRYRTNAHVVG